MFWVSHAPERRALRLFFLLAPPTVQQKMQDFELARGQEVTITVTADGSPLPTCKWYHNDQLIQMVPDRVVIIDDGPTHHLKLMDVQLTDEGQYKVNRHRLQGTSLLSLLQAVIENQMGQTELVSQVTVLDVPDIASEPVDIHIPQGGSCSLECQAPGKPLPEVKWTRGGKEIKPTENLTIESTPDGQHKLTISNAQADLTGQYVANVKHKLRTQQMIFNVLVTGQSSS